MPKNSKYSGTTVPIPEGTTATSAGYIYGFLPDPDHPGSSGEKIRIGKKAPEEGQMYPNEHYEEYQKAIQDSGDKNKEKSIEEYRFLHSWRRIVSVGFYLAVKKAAETSGLREVLEIAFGSYGADMILDMAQYMILERVDVRYMNYWFRNQMGFLADPPRGGEIRRFLRKGPVNKNTLVRFLNYWARRAMNGDHLMAYVISAENRNQPSSRYDDPDPYWNEKPFESIDTVIVYRQTDGFPVTFAGAPGDRFSLDDIEDVISRTTEDGSVPPFTVVNSWLPLTQDVLSRFSTRTAGLVALMKEDSETGAAILNRYVEELKKPEYQVEGSEQHMMTVAQPLGKNRQKKWYHHLIWDPGWEKGDLQFLQERVPAMEQELRYYMEHHFHLTRGQLKQYEYWFDLELGDPDYEDEDDPQFLILSAKRKEAFLAEAPRRAGGRIVVSSRRMKATKADSMYLGTNEMSQNLSPLLGTLHEANRFLGDDRFFLDSNAQRTMWLAWFVSRILDHLLVKKLKPFMKHDSDDPDSEKYEIYFRLKGIEAVRDFRRPAGYVLNGELSTFGNCLLGTVNVRTDELMELIQSMHDDPSRLEEDDDDDDDDDDLAELLGQGLNPFAFLE